MIDTKPVKQISALPMDRPELYDLCLFKDLVLFLFDKLVFKHFNCFFLIDLSENCIEGGQNLLLNWNRSRILLQEIYVSSSDYHR